MIVSFSGGNAFLSNFYPALASFEGVRYRTAEHAFQAAKTLAPETRMVIAGVATPSEAKRMGRSVTLRPTWEEIKYEVMRQILVSKFEDVELQRKLVATYPHVLIEGNTWGDKTWGKVLMNGRWEGENWLGYLLMELRDSIRAS